MENVILWYIPNETSLTADGPFSTEEITIKLKEGRLISDDFIWGSHFLEAQWVRILEVSEFSSCLASYPNCSLPKKLSRGVSQQVSAPLNFANKEGEYGVENEYRRFPRAPFNCNIIIHNHKHFFECRAVDISEKGISIQSEDSTAFTVGEEVIVTLLDTPYAGTFSMHATIMRVLDKPFHGYGIYFLTVNPNLKSKIAKYVIDSLGFSKEERKAS